MNQARNRHEGGSKYLLHAGFLHGIFFDPKDGGDMFLQNVNWLSKHYTLLYPRRQLFITTAVRTSYLKKSGRSLTLFWSSRKQLLAIHWLHDWLYLWPTRWREYVFQNVSKHLLEYMVTTFQKTVSSVHWHWRCCDIGGACRLHIK
jgi:hypothetical protein